MLKVWYGKGYFLTAFQQIMTRPFSAILALFILANQIKCAKMSNAYADSDYIYHKAMDIFCNSYLCRHVTNVIIFSRYIEL